MINTNLSASGLDQKESTAYLALLEIGEATMSELVTKSRLKRSTLYFLIDSLKSRGLVSTSKRGKKTYYVAENPKKLLEQADEQRRSLEQILPELLSISNNITKKPKVRYFEGKEGVKEVYRDILRFPNHKMRAWLADTMIEDFDDDFISKYYIPKRLEKKIWAEVIAPKSKVGETFKSLDTTSLRTTKLMSSNEHPLSIEISLYGPDRVGFMSAKDEIGLIIESKSIAETLQSIFTNQWNLLQEK
jgi:sugar-specific transcriptional regulator TrmB